MANKQESPPGGRQAKPDGDDGGALTARICEDCTRRKRKRATPLLPPPEALMLAKLVAGESASSLPVDESHPKWRELIQQVASAGAGKEKRAEVVEARKQTLRAALAEQVDGNELLQAVEAADPKAPLPKMGPATWRDLADVIGPIEWSWAPWLANGMLHLVASVPGMGKSALALRLAGCFLRSDLWPDGSTFTGTQGQVLWVEAEAAQAINLERAQAWGLPVERILTPFSDPLVDVNLRDAEHMFAVLDAAGREEVRFVVVDSLSAAAGGDENSAEILEQVKWLAQVARNTRRPVLVTHHLRKRQVFDSGDRVTIERLRGSSAIVQPARIVWALDCPDPDDDDTKRLSVIRNSFARLAEPLGVTISEKGVEFVEPPEPPQKETTRDRACEFLLCHLRKQPLPANELLEAAEGENISARTLKRAKQKLRIVSVKEGGKWLWSLPSRYTHEEG